jgi:hypothetical protein
MQGSTSVTRDFWPTSELIGTTNANYIYIYIYIYNIQSFRNPTVLTFRSHSELTSAPKLGVVTVDTVMEYTHYIESRHFTGIQCHHKSKIHITGEGLGGEGACGAGGGVDVRMRSRGRERTGGLAAGA